MNDPTNPAPIVQCAYTAANSIRLAASRYHDGRQAGKQQLAADRSAGDALLTAKRECPHGEWLDLLERTWPGSRRKANRLMRLATNWETVKGADSTDGALRMIARAKCDSPVSFDEEEEDDEEDDDETTSDDPDKPKRKRKKGKPKTQGTLDFDGTNEEQRAAAAAIQRKRELLDEAVSALSQLLEVMPELSIGPLGSEFAKIADGAGFGPVPEKHTDSRFVNGKTVHEETYTRTFPALETFLAALKTFVAEIAKEPA